MSGAPFYGPCGCGGSTSLNLVDLAADASIELTGGTSGTPRVLAASGDATYDCDGTDTGDATPFAVSVP